MLWTTFGPFRAEDSVQVAAERQIGAGGYEFVQGDGNVPHAEPDNLIDARARRGQGNHGNPTAQQRLHQAAAESPQALIAIADKNDFHGPTLASFPQQLASHSSVRCRTQR